MLCRFVTTLPPILSVVIATPLVANSTGERRRRLPAPKTVRPQPQEALRMHIPNRMVGIV